MGIFNAALIYCMIFFSSKYKLQNLSMLKMECFTNKICV